MSYLDLLEKEIFYIRNIPLDKIDSIIDFIQSRKQGSRIALSGMGKAGQIAHTLSTTLSSTGTPSFFIHPAEAQHGDLGMIMEDDIVITFSNSGKTRELLELVELNRKLNNNIVISIIGDQNSELEKLSNYSLVYGPVEEICPLGLTPTTSTTCMSVISDLIVVGLMKRINFTKEDYSKRHHGGYLYVKATTHEK